MQMLVMHQEDNLKQPQLAQAVQDAPQQQLGEGGRCKTEYIPRPILKRGISDDKYIRFPRLWSRYKRSTQITSEVVIRDQLLACCDEELAEELGNSEQLDHKNEE